MLIVQCICGSDEYVCRRVRELRVATCLQCGVKFLVTDQTRNEIEAMYGGSYHESRHYVARYDSDFSVARLRWQRYEHMLSERFSKIRTALDVGTANGAFVDFLRTQGIEAVGIEPDPLFERLPWIRTGYVQEFDGLYDIVTLHDVLEHVVDPQAMVASCADRLAPSGMLVIDVPDISDPAGQHHWKLEHLWYFHAAALRSLVTGSGLKFVALDYPLPGKSVVYGVRE